MGSRGAHVARHHDDLPEDESWNVPATGTRRTPASRVARIGHCRVAGWSRSGNSPLNVPNWRFARNPLKKRNIEVATRAMDILSTAQAGLADGCDLRCHTPVGCLDTGLALD